MQLEPFVLKLFNLHSYSFVGLFYDIDLPFACSILNLRNDMTFGRILIFAKRLFRFCEFHFQTFYHHDNNMFLSLNVIYSRDLNRQLPQSISDWRIMYWSLLDSPV